MNFLCGILVAVTGAIAGSFFNVLIYRLPRKESIVLPASHCPACNRPIRWYENIPVLSYIFLRGRCNGCKASISLMYPAVETLTALCALALWLFYIPIHHDAATTWLNWLQLSVRCSVLLILIPIAVIDLRHYIIPDALSLSIGLLGIAVAFLPGDLTPLQSLSGILAGGGFLLLMGLIGEYVLKKKDSMGGGDIKLMIGIGALFGWQTALLSVMIAAGAGAIIGGGLLLMRMLDKQHRIPFGPFLAIGIWGAVLWGDTLVRWYVGLLG